MRSFKIGELFEPGKTKYQEGVKFDFEQSGGKLFVTYATPTQREIMDFSKGDIKLGILYKNDIIFLLFKFGSQNWMDVPYTCFLSEPYVFDPLNNNEGYGMITFLIDANTGILKVARLLGWPHKMSKLFEQYVIDQQNKPFDITIYDRILNNIYCNYTTNDLVKMAHIFKLGDVSNE